MINNDQQDQAAGGPATPEQAPSTITPAGAARRRFARAGLGASGVLMTLASTPGMAASVCTTPSGSLSHGMQTSHTPTVPPTCGGESPGFYKNNPSGWPSSLQSVTTRTFKEIFPCKAESMTLGNTKLKDVFSLKNTGRPRNDPDPYNVGSHVLACYLNILTFRSNVLTELMLKKIWLEFQQVGYYTPSAGVKWNGTAIVDYLKTTFHK